MMNALVVVRALRGAMGLVVLLTIASCGRAPTDVGLGDSCLGFKLVEGASAGARDEFARLRGLCNDGNGLELNRDFGIGENQIGFTCHPADAATRSGETIRMVTTISNLSDRKASLFLAPEPERLTRESYASGGVLQDDYLIGARPPTVNLSVLSPGEELKVPLSLKVDRPEVAHRFNIVLSHPVWTKSPDRPVQLQQRVVARTTCLVDGSAR